MMEMRRGRRVFGASGSSQMGQKGRRQTAAANKVQLLGPRSSSPVAMYVELPCIIEQAFSTIAWGDLEDCATVRQESDSLGSQVNESDADDHDFRDYALDLLPDSPATLESSLSPAELVPFQGCVIPPLTPQRDFSPEDSVVNSCVEECNTPVQDGTQWRSITQHDGSMLGCALQVNNQLHQTLHRKQEEIDCLQERNHHLQQLASRAKHLASVLERLMTVSDPHTTEPVTPCTHEPSLSPCKRQRLDEGYETESCDSVEEMLRDISTRCNAVLHSATTGTRLQQHSETVRMFGAFAGLQTSFLNESSMRTETGDSGSSFRTSVREHCTIRTQAFPHGHAFTSRTQQGGHRFRWVPNHS